MRRPSSGGTRHQRRFFLAVADKHDLDRRVLEKVGGINDDFQVIGHAVRARVEGDELIAEFVLFPEGADRRRTHRTWMDRRRWAPAPHAGRHGSAHARRSPGC